ncbi:MAG: hypothetical protein M0Q51_17160 [Bacteroidales bacterium]|nr:hypothetical protein [Bacteroidales bacterium]
MKKVTILMTFVLFSIISYSQKLIELNYDSGKKEICEKTKKINLRVGELYKVKINGINSSVINAKLETTTYSLNSNTPELIKPLFPGVVDASQLENLFYFVDSLFAVSRLNDIYDEALSKWNILSELKSFADTLYKKTENSPNPKESSTALYNAYSLLNVHSNDELKKQTSILINFIILAKEIYQKKMEEASPDNIIAEQLIQNCSELYFYYEKLTKDNYLRYATFIIESQKSKPYLESETFKAEKDLVDLNVILVNNYVKDTVLKDVLPFYTKGSWSFDFSSGFFYDNLVEKSYYIEKRDTLINNILEEERTNSFDVAFGALGHFSYKFTNSFLAGLSMGAAISPFDAKVRYLLGASFLFGRRNQVGLNAGLSLVKFKELSNAVKEDEIGKYVPASVTSVPTYDKLISGIYFGITYNLTSKKKD